MEDWTTFGGVALRMLGAFLLALPIGWQRERSSRGLGLRTFPLVAVASSGYMILAIDIADGDPNAVGRILSGLITGIGFVGAGAILKMRDEEEVHGTSTAAGVWATGAIGAATAFGRWDLAVMIALVTFATFRLLEPVKDRLDREHRRGGVD